VIGGILNIQLERMCKGAVLAARFEALFRHLVRGSVENDEDSVRIAAVRTEI
jgi:hypothetical protein